jgi:hypothetical protein
LNKVFYAGLAPEALHYLPLFDFLDMPALRIAIATACFCGLPCFTSVLILEEITLLDLPDFNGITLLLSFDLPNEALASGWICH